METLYQKSKASGYASAQIGGVWIGVHYNMTDQHFTVCVDGRLKYRLAA